MLIQFKTFWVLQFAYLISFLTAFSIPSDNVKVINPLPNKKHQGNYKPYKIHPENEVLHNPLALSEEILKRWSQEEKYRPSRKRREVLNSPPNRNSTRGDMIEAVKFMKKFGYVPEGDDNADFIFSAETLKEKLKVVQKFGAIPETGELDEATLKLMSSPRCGVHDVTPEEGNRRKKRFIVGSSGWNKRNVTYTVANWSPKLKSKEDVRKELTRAFDHWSRYSRLTFTEIDQSEADIIIFFAEYSHHDNYPFDGQGGVLAHAYYPYEFDSFGGDIHFDESEEWALQPEDDDSGLDFFTVAVHEIGHSLGLAHSHIQSSIMFPYYKGVERNFALDYDDVMGMWELYIQRKLDGDDEYFRTSTTLTPTEAPSGDGTQNDEEIHVTYHGDADTVDEHEEKKRGGGVASPPLPPLFPNGDDDSYERETKRRQEEDRRREDERRKTIEEEERRRNEDEKRRIWEEEEEIRNWEEKQRRIREEEMKRREEEEEHRKREMESRTSPTHPSPNHDDVIPDICKGNFDAAALIRNEIFIFKGKYMWRYERKGALLQGYPAPIRSLFSGLPNVDRIDAVYERRNDSMIVFFIGQEFYVHDGNRMVEGSPRSIADYGVQADLKTTVDAVFLWAKNQKTYIFSRNLYWRRDDVTNRMDEGYPKSIERWNGIPKNLNAALTDAEGTTTFFKGNQQWKFDNYSVRPTPDSPRSDLREWTGC